MLRDVAIGPSGAILTDSPAALLKPTVQPGNFAKCPTTNQLRPQRHSP